ncbi:hypothetical protein SAMN05216489_05743 [Streptomyces sp. 3213]|uniref:SCO4225 family membrane protein n=1 Tax=Streptomyces sp. 3213.3 TaxID=1855348 RepID=UPI0008985D9E|nr:hypothetical protein [Streptomyces sp. 3213.3]SEE17329.1 hypothetical protein SAMN05216489_05743 [Streptomyces sp. 3213] [Streptomyces sp. 3213.3]
MPHPSRPRRLLALATDNWPARAYLGVVGVSFAAMFLSSESPVATAPLVLTAPLSLLGIVLPFGPGTEGGGTAQGLATGSWTVWVVLCALVNAAVIGALATRKSAASSTARPATRSARLRALLAPAVDNWPARVYLAAVTASVVFFLSAAYVLPDPGFAGVWPLITTAPLSFVPLAVSIPAELPDLSWLSPPLFAAGCALCGLVNAVLLGRLAHRLRVREAHPAV